MTGYGRWYKGRAGSQSIYYVYCSVLCSEWSLVWFGHFKYKWKRIMNRQEVMEWSGKDWIGLDVEWKPIKEEKRKSLVIYLCFWRQCNASRNWIWNKFNLWLTKFTSFKLNFLLMIYGIKLWTFFWIIEYLWGSGSVCYIAVMHFLLQKSSWDFIIFIFILNWFN